MLGQLQHPHACLALLSQCQCVSPNNNGADLIKTAPACLCSRQDSSGTGRSRRRVADATNSKAVRHKRTAS